ncbi:hypothetical protein PTKIN_Ptkin09bG0155600 [Pterospermum kingtungense]
MDPENEDLPQYEHIFQNEFSYRKHKKQKEEDIAICECKFDFSDPDSTCGERCLNVLTSTECTPGYCPCGVYCKNQKFQKCQYARTTLFKTEGRGWGLLAAENIKAGQFIIEYCGEVISWKEAKRRSQAYENQGLKDAFIISLNGSESIDATKKEVLLDSSTTHANQTVRQGSGLFWEKYGLEYLQNKILLLEQNLHMIITLNGMVVQKFAAAVVRQTVRDFLEQSLAAFWRIPIYGKMMMSEDEPAAKLLKCANLNSENDVLTKSEQFVTVDVSVKSEHQLDSTVDMVPMEGVVVNTLKTESTEDMPLYSQDTQQAFSQKNAMISRIRSNSACRNYHIRSGPMPKKKSQLYSNGKSKHLSKRQIDLKHLGQLLASKEALEEVFRYEELKNEAASQLASLYNEIRPAIEEHERDNQDSVSTSVAEKWIEASCSKLKMEFDFHSSILKNIVCTPGKACEQVKSCELEGGNDNEVKLLEF